MKKHHRITAKERSLEETFNLRKLIGKKVLSSKGLVVGRISELRFNLDKRNLEGIVVSRGIFKKPLYIGTNYLEVVSGEAIILNMEPSVLIKGRKVMTSEGEKVGKVKEVIRNDPNNEIKYLLVKSPLKKEFKIRLNDISRLGESIILKEDYNVPKKYIWQKD